MDKIISKSYNLQTIIEQNYSFNIPRYQRLYVWGDEQVQTLFNDILTAALTGKELYYIGGIITVDYPKIDNCFDLVDGQQRFTTLWLLANELNGGLDQFTKRGEELRLNFAIRDNVKAYFNQLSTFKSTDTENSNEFKDLERISKARKTIQYLIQENLKTTTEKEKFIDFVLTKLQMVITKVPLSTDLNKLFETLNNRGVQLSQHEILKAQLLSKIKNKHKRYQYNVLWNACSDMNNYLERSLGYEIGSMKEVAAQWNHWQDWNAIKYLLSTRSTTKNKNLSLDAILKSNESFLVNPKDENNESSFFHPKANDDEFEKVRSILSFPQLLLHTLRIFLYKKGKVDIQRINEKELLEIFSKHLFTDTYTDADNKEKEQKKESVAFIDLLVNVREVFDRYVIKWIEEEENNETHLIKKIYKQNQKKNGWTYYLRREKTKSFDGLALLQSVLYHSQQNTTQYWLTPFLNYALGHHSFEEMYRDLKKTDNILFSSLTDDEGLPQRTWACMEEYPDVQPTSVILSSKDKGTGFPHYWFYKMEFILWHEREKLGKKDEWTDYKMTARNSIEHISPQNPREPKDKLCTTELHNFGNLVLVTRSINSEYSDLPYKVKKAKFDDKKSKGKIDSLKSDIIYNYSDWNDANAIEHQEEMIQLMNDYFTKTNP
jgi:hypothetical protein